MIQHKLHDADYLVKHKGCPTCEGEETSHYYKRRHVEIKGEYYEFLTEDQFKELYSDDDFLKKHQLIVLDDLVNLIQELIAEHDEEHKEIMDCEDDEHNHELLESMAVGRKQGLENLLEIVRGESINE
jgi:hypothetical protein